MGSEKIRVLLIWLMAISMAFAMNSCGARKAEKTRSTEETKTEAATQSDIAKKEESSSNVDQQTTVVEKEKVREVETTYKSIDATKEATVTTPEGKKHILNNAKVVIKETTQDKETKTDTSINSETTNKSELTDKSKADNKADVKKSSEAILIDRKETNPLNLLWWLIPIFIIIFVLKKQSKIANWISWPWWV